MYPRVLRDGVYALCTDSGAPLYPIKKYKSLYTTLYKISLTLPNGCNRLQFRRARPRVTLPKMTQAAKAKQTPAKEVEIFTDGSCDTTTGRGGWGYLLRYGDRQKTASGFEPDTTNNRMELTAAVEALSALQKPCRVRLMTDSQYLKNAFTAGWLKNWQRNGWQTSSKQPVKNKDLWEQLLLLEQRHDLHWSWTKGHAGHKENELVDKLALSARRRGGAPSGSAD